MIVITAIAAAIVLAVCITLVLHKDYEDGLVGRIALAAIALAAAARIAGISEEGLHAYVSGPGILLWCGAALFFGRHLFYFLKRRYGFGGIWRATDRPGTAGKQRG